MNQDNSNDNLIKLAKQTHSRKRALRPIMAPDAVDDSPTREAPVSPFQRALAKHNTPRLAERVLALVREAEGKMTRTYEPLGGAEKRRWVVTTIAKELDAALVFPMTPAGLVAEALDGVVLNLLVSGMIEVAVLAVKAERKPRG